MTDRATQEPDPMPAKFVRFPQDKPRNPRIASDVLPEIKRAFEEEVLRVRDNQPKVPRRDDAMGVVNKTDLCNWALAGLLSLLRRDERDRLISGGRRVCEEMQRSRKQVEFPRAEAPFCSDAAGSVPEGPELPRVGSKGLPGYPHSRPRKRRDRGKGKDSASTGTDNAPGR